MKRNKKRNGNRKGAVLFTVLCFSTVMLMMSSSAMSMASYSNTVSTNNLSKTQAQISAENYLNEFIKSVEDPVGNNYSAIIKLANGHTYTNPNVINVATANESTGDNPNVGGCKIYIYNSTEVNTIVVRAEVSYGKQTDIASAVFNSKTVEFNPTNVVESGQGLGGDQNALAIEGDTVYEAAPSSSTTQVVQLHNNQSKFMGNVYTSYNIYCGSNTDTSIIQSIPDAKGEVYAPTVMSAGNIFWSQTQITSTVRPDISTGKGLKNGFVSTQNKFYGIGKSVGDRIGKYSTDKSGNINVYCKGAYIGAVPSAPLFATDRATSVSVVGGDADSINPFGRIYGNFYCYGGNFVVQSNSSGNQIIGDLVVDGDIYLYGNGGINVTGTVYCTGNIYVEGVSLSDSVDIKNKFGCAGFSSTLPSDDESKMPDINYDPGKYSRVDTVENQTRTKTSLYSQDATVNNMFADNYQNTATSSVGLQTAYANAVAPKYSSSASYNSEYYKHIYVKLDNQAEYNAYSASYSAEKQEINGSYYVSVNAYISKGFTGDNIGNWVKSNNKFQHLYILDNMYINKTAMGQLTNDMAKMKTTIVMPTNDDRYIVLPKDSRGLQIDVDFSASERQTADPTSNPKHFCNFLMGKTETDSNIDADWTRSYYGSVSSDALDVRMDSDGNSLNTTYPEWDLNDTAINDIIYDCSSSDKNTTKAESNKSLRNNIMLLAPDYTRVTIVKQAHQCIQACVYAPKSIVSLLGNAQGDTTKRALFGQLFAGLVINCQNGASVGCCLPTSGSILSYITHKNINDCKLQYFVRSKK